ncbi:MAG: hypothetical protein GXZ19_03990 [Bacteroidales bacterium]|nr:hypothetical protein [Bacteroidales bacterium]
MLCDSLKAGAATMNITPQKSHFLHGYPFVERMSRGTHDPLSSSALYLTDGNEELLFISNDIIYVDKNIVYRIRQAIFKEKGIPPSHIMIAATHTHSVPVTVECLISESDPVVPKVDLDYLKQMEAQTVKAPAGPVREGLPRHLFYRSGRRPEPASCHPGKYV